ncbi:MAG: carboxylesterase [Pseudomonadota bacterium]
MTDYLSAVEVEPTTPAKAAIIWLHGLGADGNDFVPIIKFLNLPADMAIRYVLPHAPVMAVTVNNGAVMPAWYDVMDFDAERKYNHDDLLKSAAAIQALIDREIERGIPSERILLIGFSQGGAVNFQAALSYEKRLAGLLALSTYFPSARTVTLAPANADLPVAIFHGSADPLLPISLARSSRRQLEHIGLKPDFRTYYMGHEVCNEEINDIAEFIKTCLA